MMDIDHTGMLYALVHADCSVSDALRDYFTCESVQFNSDCRVELVLSGTELRDRLTKGQMPSGMARLQSGFLYVLSDSSAVLGFDGGCRRSVGNARIVHHTEVFMIRLLLVGFTIVLCCGCGGPVFTNLGNGVGVPTGAIDDYANANGISRDAAQNRMLEESNQKRLIHNGT